MTGTTDEIKARLNIVELIGSYVRLERAGAHFKARCPFHQERTPSFMVNDERGMWHCFGCGKGGDIFAFVMEIEAIEFREALVMLAEKAGVELPRYKKEEQGRDDKRELLEALELSCKFYERQLWEGIGKKKILSYLKGRGLADESIEKFRLGYAPEGWSHLSQFLQGRGFSPRVLEQAGLVLKKERGSGHYDRFRDRIMFPIFDILGRVIGYSARVAPGGDESQAKYINTPETSVYHKSRALYGLFQAKTAMKQAKHTVIVEGNMDVIALHQAGVENTVAVSGTALTAEQLSIMKRYGEEIRLFFDMDKAGEKAARASAELAFGQDFIVTLVSLPFGKDAADLGKDDPEALKRSVSQAVPALEFFLKKLLQTHDSKTAVGKRSIVEGYTALLVLVHNPVERAHYTRLLSEAVGMDEKAVAQIVSQAFLARERREGPRLSGQPKASEAKTFDSRAERLREEIIGLLYAEASLRKGFFEKLEKETELQAFFEGHPLFFFLRQAGTRDPVELIEDPKLTNEVTRLVFGVLQPPEEKDGDESLFRKKVLDECFQSLREEVTYKEKLRTLERALRRAREQGEKEEEKRLLREFSELSLRKNLPLS